MIGNTKPHPYVILSVVKNLKTLSQSITGKDFTEGAEPLSYPIPPSLYKIIREGGQGDRSPDS
jgi:hypothetical protein